MYNPKHDVGGPITGSGPGFAEAMRKYRHRQAERAKVGKWKRNAWWCKSDGDYMDCVWMVIK